MLGISLGATLGQTIVVFFKHTVGIRWAWVLSACCILIFVALVCTAMQLIDKYVGAAPRQEELAESMKRSTRQLSQLLDQRAVGIEPMSFTSSDMSSMIRRGSRKSNTGLSDGRR